MSGKFVQSYFFLFFLFLLCGCGSTQKTTVSVTPQTAFVASGQSVPFTAAVTGTNASVTWAVNGIVGGNSTVGTISAQGNYTAPVVTQNSSAMVTAMSGTRDVTSAPSTVWAVAPGVVTSTNNPQVALYTITPPASATVAIQFSTDTSYGLTTWSQSSPTGGGAVSVFVAGMRANTLYHMRAMLQFTGSNQVNDSDHTFTTTSIPTANMPTLTASTTPGMTPQSGVELLAMLSLTSTTQNGVAVTDLAGNLLWSYNPGLGTNIVPNPVKLLPNGHFLMNFNVNGGDGTDSVLQEVDLGGDVIWQMTAAQLNQALAAATCAGCNITVVGTHHDFAVLPNGHLIVIAAEQISESGLTGFANPVTVTGDVLIDLDQNHNPVWSWSSFDHLDLNRHPYMFPDWAHTNAVVYSPSDKDLIISMRHQNWVIKIDYNDGQGTGNIVWKLGYQGDFTLENGTDPVDWFYAQHDANVISSNSSGTYQMILFDNGDDRVVDSSGTVCGTTTPCISRVPILQLDESAMTATIEWVDDLSPLYSFFGGSARLLANNNVEFAECAPQTPNGALPTIYEVTQTTPPQMVWQMQSPLQDIYRGTRIPSLYPGVQW